jgi:DNA-binding MarR family transcriptional regulator
MPRRRYLHLTQEQRAELEDVRDHQSKAYMREKAAVLLKIADGMPPHQAAQTGGSKTASAQVNLQLAQSVPSRGGGRTRSQARARA